MSTPGLFATSDKGDARQELSSTALLNGTVMSREAGAAGPTLHSSALVPASPGPCHKMDKYLFALDPMAGVFRPRR